MYGEFSRADTLPFPPINALKRRLAPYPMNFLSVSSVISVVNLFLSVLAIKPVSDSSDNFLRGVLPRHHFRQSSLCL